MGDKTLSKRCNLRMPAPQISPDYREFKDLTEEVAAALVAVFNDSSQFQIEGHAAPRLDSPIVIDEVVQLDYSRRTAGAIAESLHEQIMRRFGRSVGSVRLALERKPDDFPIPGRWAYSSENDTMPLRALLDFDAMVGNHLHLSLAIHALN
jgi:hypothetical protein